MATPAEGQLRDPGPPSAPTPLPAGRAGWWPLQPKASCGSRPSQRPYLAPHWEGGMAATPAKASCGLQALPAPHPDCPPRPPCRETRGCSAADAGVGRCGTNRPVGWVSWPSCPPTNTASHSCLRARLPPELLSHQGSAHGRDTGHTPGHPGAASLGGGTGEAGGGGEGRQDTPAAAPAPPQRWPSKPADQVARIPTQLGRWWKSGASAARSPCHRQQVEAGTLNLPRAMGAGGRRLQSGRHLQDQLVKGRAWLLGWEEGGTTLYPCPSPWTRAVLPPGL